MSAPADLEACFEFAIEIAREAADSTLRHFQAPGLSVRTKDDGSPVSVADRQAEELLRKRIGERFPDDAILGEEAGETAGSSGRRWILDPIDGTVSFIQGVPLFGTLVALEVGDEVLVGVASLPAIRETVAAARGLGARWYVDERAPIEARVSEVDQLSRAVLCSTSQRGLLRGGWHANYQRLVGKVKHERGWGDLFGHVLVATGRAEIVVDPIMSLWDNAALAPILEEAGGSFTDLAGKRTIHGGNALSTNGHLLKSVLQTLG